MISFIVTLTLVSIFPLPKKKKVKSENRLPKYFNVLIYIYIYINKV